MRQSDVALTQRVRGDPAWGRLSADGSRVDRGFQSFGGGLLFVLIRLGGWCSSPMRVSRMKWEGGRRLTWAHPETYSPPSFPPRIVKG